MPPPNNPAGTSGPGQLSRRTDGGPAQKLSDLPDAQYGENATYKDLQRQAPLSQSPSSPSGGGELPPNPAAANVVPFSADTQRPGEPVTHGAALGAGAGTEALGISPQQIEQQDVSKTQNWLPFLEMVANMPDALPGARMLLNSLKGHVQ